MQLMLNHQLNLVHGGLFEQSSTSDNSKGYFSSLHASIESYATPYGYLGLALGTMAGYATIAGPVAPAYGHVAVNATVGLFCGWSIGAMLGIRCFP